MELEYECLVCQLRAELANAEKLAGNDRKIAYLQQVMGSLAQVSARDTGPLLLDKMLPIRARHGVPTPDYPHLKGKYNDLLLGLLPKMRDVVARSRDPLATALKLSRLGNYIDFGVLKTLDDQWLLGMIEHIEREALDEVEYRHLKSDLAQARTLAFLTDNCGEIVFDRLLIECLRDRYVGLEITVVTRGQDILNDATREDACAVGLDQVARVIGNGSDIAGTQMERMSEEAAQLVRTADVRIAKGQGNFETLSGCALNTYYLFLCKCAYFSERLNVAPLTGMLLNELRLPL
ncbi:MAG: ARMT1-like domain-containing protein [Clostridia bacterium]